MLRKVPKFLILSGFLMLISCSSESSKSSPDISTEEAMRLKQYIVQGRQLYNAYCANCHQENGQGLAALYPPLDSADFMLNNLERTACLIRNGMEGPITVNGKGYNQPMPGNTELTAIEIAEIVTYISNSWGNEKGLTKVTTVSGWLENCKN